MIRDGVDLPLAHLFVQVSTIISNEAEGAERARSASERFLFYRLETLAQTKGLFRLNTELDIPFDGWGRMEMIGVMIGVIGDWGHDWGLIGVRPAILEFQVRIAELQA